MGVISRYRNLDSTIVCYYKNLYSHRVNYYKTVDAIQTILKF